MMIFHRLPWPPLFALVLVLTLAGCSSSSGGGNSPTDPNPPILLQKVEDDLLIFINRERAQRGLRQLVSDPSLQAVARGHSEAMRDQGFFAHVDPSTGDDFEGRLRKAGVPFGRAGENLAFATNIADPARTIHDELMGSSGHRGNILNSGYQRVGIGAAQGGNTVWVTQLFITDP